MLTEADGQGSNSPNTPRPPSTTTQFKFASPLPDHCSLLAHEPSDRSSGSAAWDERGNGSWRAGSGPTSGVGEEPPAAGDASPTPCRASPKGGAASHHQPWAPCGNVRGVLVIGAGVAGLQAAKTLSRAGYKVMVLEQEDDIGGVWLRNYHGVGLQGGCYLRHTY